MRCVRQALLMGFPATEAIKCLMGK